MYLVLYWDLPFKVTHGTTATPKKGQECESTNWNEIAVVQSSMCSTWSSASSTVFSWSLQGGNTCTKTSHDTAVASYLQCCPYRHRQNVGKFKFNQTVCFLVLSWKPLPMFHCKKGNKNPQPSLTGKPVSTERQQCLSSTGVTVPLDVGWCEEKQVTVTELFQGLVSDATDGCKIRRR
jgi:hypothetical protein